MQPIHYAASSGCAEVLTTLIDHFEVDPAECSSVRVTIRTALYNQLIVITLIAVGFTATALCCNYWQNRNHSATD